MNTHAQVVGNLQIDRDLYNLVDQRFIPGTGLRSEDVWRFLGSIVAELGPKNRQLLEARDKRQSKIDTRLAQWRESGGAYDTQEMASFYRDLGYLVPDGPSFTIGTTDVDPEISEIAGPQLVVPLSNARFAANAANARWVSMQGAVYFSDLLGEEDGLQKEPFYKNKNKYFR